MVDGVKARGIGATTPLLRDGAKAAEGRFLVDEGGASPTQMSRLSTAAAIGLEDMLALQAVDEADERDRTARKRGAAMLANLTSLQRAMLAGADPTTVLRALDAVSREDLSCVDPRLEAVLRAVVLRARVELARQAFGQKPKEPA